MENSTGSSSQANTQTFSEVLSQSSSRRSGTSSNSSSTEKTRSVTHKLLGSAFLLREHNCFPGILFPILLIFQSFQLDGIFLAALSPQHPTIRNVADSIGNIFLFGLKETLSPSEYLLIVALVAVLALLSFVAIFWGCFKSAQSMTSKLGIFALKILSTVVFVTPYIAFGPFIWFFSRLTSVSSSADYEGYSGSVRVIFVILGILGGILLFLYTYMTSVYFINPNMRTMPTYHRIHARDDRLVIICKWLAATTAWNLAPYATICSSVLFAFTIIILCIQIGYMSFYSRTTNIIQAILNSKTAVGLFIFSLYMVKGNEKVYSIGLICSIPIGIVVGILLAQSRLYSAQRGVMQAVKTYVDKYTDPFVIAQRQEEKEMKNKKKKKKSKKKNKKKKKKEEEKKKGKKSTKEKGKKKVPRISADSSEIIDGEEEEEEEMEEMEEVEEIEPKKRSIVDVTQDTGSGSSSLTVGSDISGHDIAKPSKYQCDAPDDATGSSLQGSLEPVDAITTAPNTQYEGNHIDSRQREKTQQYEKDLNARSVSRKRLDLILNRFFSWMWSSSPLNEDVSSLSHGKLKLFFSEECQVTWMSAAAVEMSLRPLLLYLRTSYILFHPLKCKAEERRVRQLLIDIIGSIFDNSLLTFGSDNPNIMGAMTMFLYAFNQDKLLYMLRRARQSHTISSDTRCVMHTAEQLFMQEQVDNSVSLKHSSALRKARRLTSQGTAQLKSLWKIIVKNAAAREKKSLDDDSIDVSLSSSSIEATSPHGSSRTSSSLRSNSRNIGGSVDSRNSSSRVMAPQDTRSGQANEHGYGNTNNTDLYTKISQMIHRKEEEIVLNKAAKGNLSVSQLKSLKQCSRVEVDPATREKVLRYTRELAHTMQEADDTFHTLLKHATPAVLRVYAHYVLCVCGDAGTSKDCIEMANEMVRAQEAVRTVAPRLSSAAIWRELVSDTGAAVEDTVSQDYLALGGETFAPGQGIQRMQDEFGSRGLVIRIFFGGLILSVVFIICTCVSLSIGKMFVNMYGTQQETTYSVMFIFHTMHALRSIPVSQSTVYAEACIDSLRRSGRGLIWEYDFEDEIASESMLSLLSELILEKQTSYTAEDGLVAAYGVKPMRSDLYFPDSIASLMKPSSLSLLEYPTVLLECMPSEDWEEGDDIDSSIEDTRTLVSSLSSAFSTLGAEGTSTVEFFEENSGDLYISVSSDDDSSTSDVYSATVSLGAYGAWRSFNSNAEFIATTLGTARADYIDYFNHFNKVIVMVMVIIMVMVSLFIALPMLNLLSGGIVKYYASLDNYVKVLFSLSFEDSYEILKNIISREKSTKGNITSSKKRRESKLDDFEELRHDEFSSEGNDQPGSGSGSGSEIRDKPFDDSLSGESGGPVSASSGSSSSLNAARRPKISSDDDNASTDTDDSGVRTASDDGLDSTVRSFQPTQTETSTGVASMTKSTSFTGTAHSSSTGVGTISDGLDSSTHKPSTSFAPAMATLTIPVSSASFSAPVSPRLKAKALSDAQLGKSIKRTGSQDGIKYATLSSLPIDNDQGTMLRLSQKPSSATSSPLNANNALDEDEHEDGLDGTSFAPAMATLTIPVSSASFSAPVSPRLKAKALSDAQLGKSIKRTGSQDGIKYATLSSLPIDNDQGTMLRLSQKPSSATSSPLNANNALDEAGVASMTKSTSFTGTAHSSSTGVGTISDGLDSSTHKPSTSFAPAMATLTIPVSSASFSAPVSPRLKAKALSDAQLGKSIKRTGSQDGIKYATLSSLPIDNDQGTMLRLSQKPSSATSSPLNANNALDEDEHEDGLDEGDSGLDTTRSMTFLKIYRFFAVILSSPASFCVVLFGCVIVFVLCLLISLVAIIKSTHVLEYSHEVGSLSILGSSALALSTEMVLAEVGSLSPAHALASRDEIIVDLIQQLRGINTTYEQLVQGTSSRKGIIERYPSSMPLIFTEQCLNLGNSSCADEDKETLHDVIDSFILDLTAIAQGEQTEGPLFPDFDSYVSLNATSYDQLVGGMVSLDEYLSTSLDDTVSLFSSVSVVMIVGAVLIPLVLVYVGNKEVSAALQQRDLVFTTFDLVPVDAIPRETKVGQTVSLLVLFMRSVNDKLQES
ncbi:Tetratricopeptide repeat protein 14 like protein [Aduncisulcus paluster]|uniref:Tetratricopeptide repeat protein 14 like protein n=1 Tax=Aduncisulcus paluster TaxID=2918883 RepID=A0ABQ5K2Y1_9EUKA|nr:Tetratricopeptide repeat protein 14 like protein [Aduncisulcus paluster]